jgi:hypothetical protein
MSLKLVISLLAVVLFSTPAAIAKSLEGQIETENEIKRISREHYVPSSSNTDLGSAIPAMNPADFIDSMKSSGPRLKANIENNAPLMTPSGPFDIGDDRNSELLRVAWELWHKQVSHELWVRTRRRTEISGLEGSARATITVYRDHRILSQITEADGSPFIAQAYSQAIASLHANDGLEFPSGSQRESVSFSYKFIQARNIIPGYDWKHGDVENIRHDL